MKRLPRPAPSDPPGASERSSPGLLALGFVALALIWAQVGYLQPSVSRPLGGILWLVTIVLSGSRYKWWWMGAYTALLFNPYGAVFRQEGLLLLGLLPWAGGKWGYRWVGAAFLAGVGGWVWGQLPAAWVPFNEVISQWTLSLSGADLAPPAAGIPLFFIAACFPLVSALSERRLAAPLYALGGLTLGLLGYWLLLGAFDRWLHALGSHSLHDAFSLQWILIVFLAVVLWIWGAFAPPQTGGSSPRKIGLILAIPMFLGALLISAPTPTLKPTLDRQVLFFDRGYLNWEKPIYGRYGQHSAGMFGLIPDYLTWRGFNVVRTDSLTDEQLDSVGAVVIINLIGGLSDIELQALWKYVERGGSLLLLGDHTGLSDIREPSNRVLQPYGMELNFDTAIPRRNGWIGSLTCAPHPITEWFGLDRLSSASGQGLTSIWVGASLSVASPATPLIVGREAFADLGNVKNKKDGYLGDMRYQPSERLGELTLVAEAKQGRGKVVVFGDTSPLQNGALIRSGDFIVNVFNYLLAATPTPTNIRKYLGIVLLLFSLFFGFVLHTGKMGVALHSLAVFCVILITSQLRPQSSPVDLQHWTLDAPPRALIDHTHAPRLPLNQVSDEGQWGLQNCLLRSGFLPQVLERWQPERLVEARMLIEIAPGRGFSKKQRQELKQFMQDGGLVVVCCGAEEFDGSKSLLADYGLAPLYLPLGPAEVPDTIRLPENGDSLTTDQAHDIKVHFHEAWSIQTTNPKAQNLLEGYGKPIVQYVPVGQGGLLYIADSEFLSNRNLESPNSRDYFEGNILFLRYLLREYAGGK